MVLGDRNGRSGSGICCNAPGPRDPSRRFRGVFLRGQTGVSICTGRWGPNQVPLGDLLALNPTGYSRLRSIFDTLEQAYGADRYLEFTIDGDEVYVLQHCTRQRSIEVD